MSAAGNRKHVTTDEQFGGQAEQASGYAIRVGDDSPCVDSDRAFGEVVADRLDGDKRVIRRPAAPMGVLEREIRAGRAGHGVIAEPETDQERRTGCAKSIAALG
jgi:hypothetical protein